MESKNVIKVFGPTHKKTRLSVFRLLVVAGSDGMLAGVIAEELSTAPSTLSHHLALLERAGLLQSWRVQRQIFYAANYDRICKVIVFLIKNCCNGRPEVFEPLKNYFSNELNYQESTNHIIQIDGNQMDNGSYLTYMHIESNATGAITIPVSVQIGYQADLGDINYDGTINVQDVVLLISMILNAYPPNLEADINQDGEINILDVVLLIESILS